MGLSSWQVLWAWTCHRQPQKNNCLYFLIELIEIYLPVPKVCFSKERNEAPSPKYCSCKIPLYQCFFEFSKISIFGGLTPSFYVVFLWRLRITRLESHNSKQMMVYEQITFFIKKQNFSKLCFGSKIYFLIGKSISLLKKLKTIGKETGKHSKMGVSGRREASSILC